MPNFSGRNYFALRSLRGRPGTSNPLGLGVALSEHLPFYCGGEFIPKCCLRLLHDKSKILDRIGPTPGPQHIHALFRSAGAQMRCVECKQLFWH